jgi:hypothetical protein
MKHIENKKSSMDLTTSWKTIETWKRLKNCIVPKTRSNSKPHWHPPMQSLKTSHKFKFSLTFEANLNFVSYSRQILTIFDKFKINNHDSQFTT